jgi:hypothetical protein
VFVDYKVYRASKVYKVVVLINYKVFKVFRASKAYKETRVFKDVPDRAYKVFKGSQVYKVL